MKLTLFSTAISGTFGKYIKRLFYKSKNCTSSNLSYRLLHSRSDIRNYYHPITDGIQKMEKMLNAIYI